MLTSKQLEFNFMKPEWEQMLDKQENKDLNELLDFIQNINKVCESLVPLEYIKLESAEYNPCSSCLNKGKGPCFCILPDMYNGPKY